MQNYEKTANYTKPVFTHPRHRPLRQPYRAKQDRVGRGKFIWRENANTENEVILVGDGSLGKI